MTDPIIVIGAGGFGREALDVIDALNQQSGGPRWTLLGVADDGPSERSVELLEKRGVRYLGTTTDLIKAGERPFFVVGIGNPQVREQIATKLERAGFRAATLVHPAATVGTFVTIGEGSVLLAGVRLTTNIALGRHVHLNPNVTIGHDTSVGDFVSANPAVSVSGECTVEPRALLGVGATVINRLRVGHDAVVGAGACVVRDVPSGVTVKGVPAR